MEIVEFKYLFIDLLQAWIWEYPLEDGEHHDLFMDPGEEIRFRITAEDFVDTSPSGPDLQSSDESEGGEKKIPFKIIGAVNEPGLGLLKWWDQ